jgi:SAM-dependent methyltransferase
VSSPIAQIVESPSDLEEVPCPNCASQRRSPRREGRDPTLGPGRSFAIVRCDDCGQHYTSPRPTAAAISRYYPAEYHAYHIEQAPPAGRDGSIKNLVLRDAFGAPALRPTGWRRAAARLVRCVRSPQSFGHGVPYRGRGRLLDFGCGSGKFLRRMHALGWNVTGIDFSDDAVRDVRASGLRALQGSLPHPDLHPGTFDVVTMRHALEHVPDPRAVLRSAWELLDAGGLLLVAVPNGDGWDGRYFGDAALCFDLPRHLTHFGPRTLAEMFRREGIPTPRVEVISRANWIRKAARRDPRPRAVSMLLRLSALSRVAAIICRLTGDGNELIATAVKA